MGKKSIPDKIIFAIDIEGERCGYYFNNSPYSIVERKMSKIFTVGLITYKEIKIEDHTHCSGEMDADDFFYKLGKSSIKPDIFYSLFIDHGKKFLPKFIKWEYVKKII